MDEAHQKALTIFSPYYLEKALRVEKEGLKFIQYTSEIKGVRALLAKSKSWKRALTPLIMPFIWGRV
jgi:hypothetical protein